MKRSLILFLSLLLFSIQSNGQSTSDPERIQKVKVAGHAHMDPVYRWRWNEIENREIFKTFSDVLNMMDKYPELRFSQSTLLYYASIQQRFPSLFEKVKQSMQDKRWSVVGGQWVETDESMPSGESLIRQFLISKDYYSKNLNIENIPIAWSPDVFTGHPLPGLRMFLPATHLPFPKFMRVVVSNIMCLAGQPRKEREYSGGSQVTEPECWPIKYPAIITLTLVKCPGISRIGLKSPGMIPQ